MSSNKKYAILDTDFISKMYITRKDENSQLIKLIVQIEDFDFICHHQTLVELQRHNSDAANWLQKEKSTTVYSDLDLITLLENIYNKSAFYLFANLLKTSCDVFSSNYYNTHYGYNIFNMLYNNELKLLKNGHFCKNDLNE